MQKICLWALRSCCWHFLHATHTRTFPSVTPPATLPWAPCGCVYFCECLQGGDSQGWICWVKGHAHTKPGCLLPKELARKFITNCILPTSLGRHPFFIQSPILLVYIFIFVHLTNGKRTCHFGFHVLFCFFFLEYKDWNVILSFFFLTFQCSPLKPFCPFWSPVFWSSFSPMFLIHFL